MKTLLISINSISENTGGGLYLRSIANELYNESGTVDLICKESELDIRSKEAIRKVHCLKKNIFFDLLSRFFLVPCFLGAHLFKIIKIIKNGNYSSIHFHSSRTLPIAIIVKLLFKNNVCVHFDNIEYKLSLKITKRPIELPLRIIDSILLYFYERKMVNFISKVTFITLDDQKVIKPKIINSIFPIKIPIKLSLSTLDIVNERKKQENKKIIFVASFDHSPNFDAALQFIKIASLNLCFDFLIVGRNACKLKPFIENIPNLKIYSNISDDLLQTIYLTSHLVLCPVQDGGGMKTKIAEAMSYRLPVLCSPHSSIGYDAVLDKTDLIQVVDFNDCSSDITEMLKIYDDFNLIKRLECYYDLFKKNYSF
ncbi:glycosyltransferase [Providencia rettgeri]